MKKINGAAALTSRGIKEISPIIAAFRFREVQGRLRTSTGPVKSMPLRKGRKAEIFFRGRQGRWDEGERDREGGDRRRRRHNN